MFYKYVAVFMNVLKIKNIQFFKCKNYIFLSFCKNYRNVTFERSLNVLKQVVTSKKLQNIKLKRFLNVKDP